MLRHRLPKCSAPPFRVGDRVKDISGEEATVVKLQRTAEFGYGKVQLEFGNGRRQSILFLDNTGLEPVEPQRS